MASKQRAVINSKMRRFMLDKGSKSDWLDVLDDVNDYNARVRRLTYESIPFITEKIIRAQIKKMDTISKREKIRAGLAKREEVGQINITLDETTTTVRPQKKQTSRRNIKRSIKRRS